MSLAHVWFLTAMGLLVAYALFLVWELRFDIWGTLCDLRILWVATPLLLATGLWCLGVFE